VQNRGLARLIARQFSFLVAPALVIVAVIFAIRTQFTRQRIRQCFHFVISQATKDRIAKTADT
jgi:hypothetical protein